MIRKREASTKRVGIWLRVSTEDQVRGESPETHERRARLYAEAKGWSVVEVYRLDAVSGKTVKEHPEAKRMLKDVKDGTITGLIFSKLARLARNTKELLEFAEQFREHEADLISLAESIDTSSPAGRLFYTMIAAMAQWEREEISARVAASVPVRAQMGKSTGGAAPYGFRWENKQLVVDEKEAPVRKLMYELFREHKRRRTVARLLNERGLRTRSGAKFSDTTVERLLTDTSAKGIRIANSTYSTGDGKRWKRKPKEDWVSYDIPAIVSVALWDEINAIIKGQKTPGKTPARRVVHLFSGLAWCHCGEKMYVPTQSPKYTCLRCKNKIPTDDLEAVFHEQLRGFLISPDDIRKHLESGSEKITAGTELLAVLQAERAKLATEVDKLYTLYQSGAIDTHGFGDKYKPLAARIQQLDDDIPRTQAEVDVLKIAIHSQEEVLAEARDLFLRWPTLAQGDKRAIVETIVEKVIVGQGDVEIMLLYSPPDTGTPPSSPSSSGSSDPSSHGSEVPTRRQRTLIHAWPFIAGLRLTLKSLKLDGIPTQARNPQTIGDHILARRLALGLYQRNVAKLMGVDMFTVINWEKGRTAPPSRCMPALLKFLGYDPRPTPTTIGGKLTAWRESDGLTVREAARRLGIDEGTLGRWEAGETILLHKHRKMVAALIDSTLKDLHHQMAGRWMAVPGRGTDLARARAKSLEMRSCQAAPKARR